MGTSTSGAMIYKLHVIFATHGQPETLAMDNGGNFTSEEFPVFLKKNCVEHIFTALYQMAYQRGLCR